MSTMGQPRKSRRPRRQFDVEFKASAVRLVLDEGKSVGRVARDLDLTESALRTWVDHARADRTQGRTGLTTEEREELRRLRKENRELRTDREILKKAAVSSTDRCNAMNDHNEEGSWIAFVVHACQLRRRRSYGSGGSAVSRSATSVGRWVVSRERFTTLFPPAGVSRRSHAPGHNVHSA